MEFLEQHFETAFDAPDGIAKLRELILTLAMKGKLVEQDPNEPSAQELVQKVESKKQLLIKEKIIKKPKPIVDIESGEIPYKLPGSNLRRNKTTKDRGIKCHIVEKLRVLSQSLVS